MVRLVKSRSGNDAGREPDEPTEPEDADPTRTSPSDLIPVSTDATAGSALPAAAGPRCLL
jgi:hypothetical protein